MEEIIQFLEKQYQLTVMNVKRLTTGVGGDTYLVTALQGRYVFKIVDVSDINRPESEPSLCYYLVKNGIPVSKFIPNTAGRYVLEYENRYCHLQQYIEGNTLEMNSATEWFMQQSPLLLGNIHRVLKNYEELPVGIGREFFTYMTLKRANESYRHSLETAIDNKLEQIIEDLEFRIQLTESLPDMKFDVDRLTYANTHGDFTVNQIICNDGKVEAVIDWTSACRHPVIWEVTRSFFYADPSCIHGHFDEKRYEEYVNAYCSVSELNDYDRENILRLYYYQLAVCDYYSQYLNAEESKKEEFLKQAKFATSVLRENIDKIR